MAGQADLKVKAVATVEAAMAVAMVVAKEEARAAEEMAAETVGCLRPRQRSIGRHTSRTPHSTQRCDHCCQERRYAARQADRVHTPPRSRSADRPDHSP